MGQKEIQRVKISEIILSELKCLKCKVPKVTLTCHPEAKPKDLANDKEILRFAQNDSFAITLAHFRHCKLTSYIKSSKLE